jgi:choline dehydrogenase-like flavoprotein
MAQLNFVTDEPTLFRAMTAENLELLAQGRGPLTSNIPEGALFFRSRPGLAAPDVQFHFAPSMFYDEGLTAPHADGFAFGPVIIKPTSRGRVLLRTPRADSKPLVATNFLTTEEDRASMIAGARVALEIAAQPALRAVIKEPFIAPASDSEEDIMAFVLRAAQPVYHPTSTCAIGEVVDSALRVHGVEGLRVADASVMPRITRGNTNAATIMIAEKASDMIRAA